MRAKAPLTPTLSPRGEGVCCGLVTKGEANSGVPSLLGEKDRMRGFSAISIPIALGSWRRGRLWFPALFLPAPALLKGRGHLGRHVFLVVLGQHGIGMEHAIRAE